MTEQPDREAYATTGVLEARCPHCGAAPGAWCRGDDGRGVRRIPCVGRLAAAVRALRGGGTDPNEGDSGERDLRDGYPEYRRPPTDVVRKTPPKGDLPPIQAGPGRYVSDEVITAPDGNLAGVTHTEAAAYIARPIMPKTVKGEGK
ncbi:hypothetical protein MMAN_04340 [Mycobacterium mantenii]|uniref:DNA-binding phage zinc finger domain-containing protein n=1 Tax=Mycobacterium mantenii TaxID=560555 RepID=A0ABM7JLC8_MYCNT|nr:hypothetical protein [Mycobacterium mantenii]MCV7241167.1 hypothetical protein [Mycobacterium mantenii]BBY36300.1 hypothetical protein MMAN_04340 [Mycobacterium mantenii]